jgi:parallel beta-helix repeat protein
MKEGCINHSNGSGSFKLLYIIFFLFLSAISPIFAISISACGTLNSPNTVYTLANNVSSSGTCFTIAANNVTLDCQGHTISHTGSGYGVTVIGFNFTTVKNCRIVGNTSVWNNYGIYLSSNSNNNISNNIVTSHFDYGIYLSSSSNNDVSNNNVSLSNYTGIYLSSSSNNTLFNNNATLANYGIHLYSSSKNTIFNNIVTSNYDGIIISSSSNNTIFNNTAKSNTFGIGFISSDYNTIFNNNVTLNNYSIYLFSSSNNNISNNTITAYFHGAVFNSNSNYNTFTNNTITAGGDGARLDSNSDYNTFTNNNITANYDGAYLWYSSYNNFTNNNITITANGYGAYLGYNSNNIFINNTIIAVLNGNGVTLVPSSNNTFINNNITSTYVAVHISSDPFNPGSNNTFTNNTITSTNHYGVELYSDYNTFTNNTISGYYAGAYFYSGSNNTLTNNKIQSSSSYAMYLTSSSNNRIYNNLLNGSSGPVSVDSNSNFWNTTLTSGPNIVGGPYIGGNFYVGFSESCTDSDANGICDSPYSMNSGNIDYLPLATPPTPLSSCQNITSSGRYALTQNVSSPGTCFTVLADGVTLNCNRNTIYYANLSRGFGINVSGHSYVKIMNCNIQQANNGVTYSDGIYFYSSSYNNVINVSVNATGSYSNGVSFYYTNNSNLSSSNITAKYVGVGLQVSLFNKIINNKIISTNSIGLVLTSSADYNLISNNSITANSFGITIDNSAGNSFSNNVVRSLSNVDFDDPSGSPSNTITNMTFNGSMYPTTASFTYSGAIQIDSANAIPSPGFLNVSKYLNITSQSPGAWVSIHISYSNDTIGANETKLKLYKYNETAGQWQEVPGSGVNTSLKIVYGTISSFSIFAPLAALDSTPPSIQLISPANNTYTNATSMIFTFNATDDQSTTLNCSLYINNILNKTNSSVINGSITSFQVTGLTDGSYNWKINCSDQSGNSNVSETRTFTVDTIKPSITINSPSSNSFVNSKLISINLTVIDANINYTNISIINATNGALINSTVTLSSGTFVVVLSVPTDGVYNITAITYDKVGYSNSSTVTNITVDSTNPSLTINYPSSNVFLNSKTISINLTVSDVNLNYTNISILQGASIINSTVTSSSGTFVVTLSVPSDGVYNISVVTKDKANNQISASITNITVDSTNPSLTINYPSSNVFLNSKTISINLTVSDVNLNYTNISILQGSTIINSTITSASGTFIVTLSVPNDGVYNITATTYDKANNQNSSSITNITVDSTNPSLSINSPSSNVFLNSKTISINLTVSDVNLNYTNISILQGASIINSTVTSSSGTFVVTLSVPNDGVYNISAVTYDLAGNSNTSAATNITVDTIYPLVSIVSPKQTSPIFIRSGVPVNVEFNYTEVNPLNYTLYLVNSSGNVVSTKTGSLSIGGENISVSDSLATTELENGNYSVNVSVYDAAGHQTMVQEQNNVIIDNSIPGVIIISPSSSEYIIGDTIVLNLTIFDENLNYTNISIYNSTGFVLSYITLQSGTFTIDFTLPDDMYFINVTSYDLSGNNASNSISNVELDSTSPFYPTKCLTILLPGEYYLTSNLNSNDTTCIEIDSDNVLLDGQGHEVHNLGSAEVPGILVEDQTNITIQNIIISHYVPDIKMVNVTGAKVHNVTHNGGQLDLISSRDINVSDSSFENSTVEGMIINNSDKILIFSTSVRNSQSDNVVLINSNASFINSTITNNAVNSSGFRIAGSGSIEIFNSSISVPLNSLEIDAGGSSNLNISVSDSNIQNSTNVIFIADASSDFQSRNIYVNLWKNNIGGFTKAVLASNQINGSGRILLNNDFYGNYWGSSVYPYLNTSSQLVNVSGVNDNYPYKEMNGWNKEKRFWLSSSEQSVLSQDGRLNITMNSNSIANLVLSRLAGELFIIEDMDPINISGENSLIDAKLHYRFGTYKSIYVPAEVEEPKPIISALPIYFTANLSGLVSQDGQGNVTIVEYDKSKNEWPYIGIKHIPVDSSLMARTKLQAINGSIEFAVGKKIADLISIDNVSPTVSLLQSGGLVIANYVDPLLNITQNDNGAGITEKIISSDQIVPLFIPAGANISFAQFNLSANSGSPSFIFSVYLHTNVTSDSPGVLYYMQDVNSLQPEGIVIDLTSQISNAMSNCSTMHKGSYCLLYLAFNSLTGGSVKLSNISINYSYASGIKLPDTETSSSITSLTEQPNHDSNIAYLSGSGGQDILLLTLPFKAYIKSAQITLVGEQWDSSYPSDVSFWIGNGSTNSYSNSPIMVYNGQFNTSVQIISPFVNALNAYISTHDATEKGEYIIPLTFNSSTKGKVRVSSILIDYDLRNQYDPSSPSYIDGFSDGRESVELEFTPSETSHILYIDVPKYAKVSNITISVSPSQSITFDIDFLNDGQVEIQNSTQVQPVNLTSYLNSCTPTKFMIPYGRTCRIPINVTANLDAYPSVNVTFESVSEFISPIWRYTGSDSEIVRGSMRKLDFLSLPSMPTMRTRSINLEHHSIYSLQNGDIVIAYAVDMAGNRGSNQFTFTAQQAQPPTQTPVQPLLQKIPLSGFMNCTNSLAYVITEPGASITVLYRSTGQFVTGGTADQTGRFEFTPSITGSYLIRSSKQGFEENSIVLTAMNCEIKLAISAKKILDCSSGSCIIKLEAQTNKISDFQLKLSDFIPSAVIKTVNSITDRLGSKFLAYGYTDSIISIPPTQTISSTFSVLVDTFLTAVAPEYQPKENKLIFTINNPSEDLSVDEVTIPLPEEARGKEIKSIEYVSADGTKMNITDYVVESNRIIVKQTIAVKKG